MIVGSSSRWRLLAGMIARPRATFVVVVSLLFVWDVGGGAMRWVRQRGVVAAAVPRLRLIPAATRALRFPRRQNTMRARGKKTECALEAKTAPRAHTERQPKPSAANLGPHELGVHVLARRDERHLLGDDALVGLGVVDWVVSMLPARTALSRSIELGINPTKTPGGPTRSHPAHSSQQVTTC